MCLWLLVNPTSLLLFHLPLLFLTLFSFFHPFYLWLLLNLSIIAIVYLILQQTSILTIIIFHLSYSSFYSFPLTDYLFVISSISLPFPPLLLIFISSGGSRFLLFPLILSFPTLFLILCPPCICSSIFLSPPPPQSLLLFPQLLTISSPDRPQTSLVTFMEISPGKITCSVPDPVQQNPS